ncbi:Cytochrome b561 [Zhongshania aliphaticivorans]|uniref:Cytochrome b561 n=1 Tax=Zhongshania aliphaticivorans TaxID=1470434 RepID=A0A5S9PLA3_9GAMM|nr:cytochrome b [Zhongshania aliphaticivorans]CAA0105096.1 Cytochrome b561 [Zhongshania aliphaticivorans]CAA0105369.1 Cytochrome b561 [Zhongshania aliphaticivorans]
MGLKNTANTYGSIAKCLHWLTAALFLGSYISVYYLHWFTEARTPESFNVLQIHLSIGVSIAVVVLLRILWRISNSTPSLEPGTKLEHLAAHAGHYALYAIMIIMPITGYMGTGANVNFFFLFEIPKFENTLIFDLLVNNGLGMTFKEFEKPMDFLHKDVLGAWVVWLLILGHALAALYHHFVKKDQTLHKMTIGK